MNWVKAIKGEAKGELADRSTAAQAHQTMLLGIVGAPHRAGRKILYDGERMVVNQPLRMRIST